MNTKARIGGLLLILGTVLFVGGAVGYITRHLPAEHISGSGALALIFVGVGAKFYILVLLYPIIYFRQCTSVVSLSVVGCALENLLIATEHFGYGHQVAYFPEPANEELVATVKFMPHGEPSPFREPALFDTISNRHTNRKFYEERPIPQSDLQHLQNRCVEEGIWLHMTDDLEIKRKADELIIRGDTIHFSDLAFREELGYWIGQGLLGTPWLMSKMAQLTVTYMNMSKGQAKKDSEVLMSAPVLAALSSEVNNRESQVKVGQVFERVCLAATMLGIRVHPMSQILEIPELKTEVGKLIPKSDVFPQHTFRLGYAEPEKGHTPRRQLEEVLV